jgi:uncharacterized repeat protein (TIGR02543 family)
MAMPSTTVSANLYCVGSPSDPIEEGSWTGVKLADLLQEANVSTTAVKVALYATPYYATDLSLSTAMADDIIVAYEKDGTSLGEEIRLVAPGLWGYKWAVGLSKITLVDYDFRGTYEEQGYPDSGLFGSFLYVNTNFPSVPFSVNGTTFATGPDGSAMLSLENGDYDISLAPEVALSDGARLTFLQWADGSASPTRTVSLSSDTTLSASYVTQYLLAVTVAPPGGGTVEPSGNVWGDAGEEVTITAVPSEGYSFTGWSGDLSGTVNPGQVAMDGPRDVTANFQGKAVPEFPGPLQFLTVVAGILLALLVGSRMEPSSNRDMD